LQSDGAGGLAGFTDYTTDLGRGFPLASPLLEQLVALPHPILPLWQPKLLLDGHQRQHCHCHYCHPFVDCVGCFVEYYGYVRLLVTIVPHREFLQPHVIFPWLPIHPNKLDVCARCLKIASRSENRIPIGFEITTMIVVLDVVVLAVVVLPVVIVVVSTRPLLFFVRVVFLLLVPSKVVRWVPTLL
jgi:hypothetical protein